MGKDKLKTTALCVIALKTHPNRFRSGNRLTVSVWKQDQEFTFLIHDRVLSLEISEKKMLAKLHGSFLMVFMPLDVLSFVKISFFQLTHPKEKITLLKN